MLAEGETTVKRIEEHKPTLGKPIPLQRVKEGVASAHA
jgi:hypothetical protein